MQPLPHHYVVAATGDARSLRVSAHGLPDLASAAPAEFDGPGDQWSPESLLCAAVASCFVLTFRAVARASRLEWRNLECNVEGLLERIDGVMQFTRLITWATLTVDSTQNPDLCRRALEKAEHGCLVANSLTAQRELRAEIRTAEVPRLAANA
jgi:organic hydroperoxide reductase OsmC/OhrA